MRPTIAKLTQDVSCSYCSAFFSAIASAGCSKESESKEAHLARAKQYLADAQYDKAETGISRRAPPRCGRPRRAPRLGHHVPGAGPPAEASQLLKSCELLRRSDLQLGWTKTSCCPANIRRRERRLARARQRPGRAEALILIADAAVALGDLDEARLHRGVLRATRSGPRRISAWPWAGWP